MYQPRAFGTNNTTCNGLGAAKGSGLAL